MIEKARSKFLFTICLTVLLVIISFSPPLFSQEKLGGKVYETTLANGLKIILLENHKAPVVTVQIWYRAGSRNEAWGKTGLSHLVEHMMFKGTKTIGSRDYLRE